MFLVFLLAFLLVCLVVERRPRRRGARLDLGEGQRQRRLGRSRDPPHAAQSRSAARSVLARSRVAEGSTSAGVFSTSGAAAAASAAGTRATSSKSADDLDSSPRDENVPAIRRPRREPSPRTLSRRSSRRRVAVKGGTGAGLSPRTRRWTRGRATRWSSRGASVRSRRARKTTLVVSVSVRDPRRSAAMALAPARLRWCHTTHTNGPRATTCPRCHHLDGPKSSAKPASRATWRAVGGAAVGAKRSSSTPRRRSSASASASFASVGKPSSGGPIARTFPRSVKTTSSFDGWCIVAATRPRPVARADDAEKDEGFVVPFAKRSARSAAASAATAATPKSTRATARLSAADHRYATHCPAPVAAPEPGPAPEPEPGPRPSRPSRPSLPSRPSRRGDRRAPKTHPRPPRGSSSRPGTSPRSRPLRSNTTRMFSSSPRHPDAAIMRGTSRMTTAGGETRRARGETHDSHDTRAGSVFSVFFDGEFRGDDVADVARKSEGWEDDGRSAGVRGADDGDPPGGRAFVGGPSPGGHRAVLLDREEMKRSRCRRVCARVRGDELERGDGARAVEGEVRVSLVSIVEANRGRAERGAGEFRLAGDVSRAAEGTARVGFAAGSRGEHVEIRAVGHRHGDVAGGHRRATERLRAGRRQELGEIPRHGEVGEARVVDVVDEDRHRGRKSGVVVVRGGAGFVPRVVPATRKRAAPRSRPCARRRIPETRCPFGTTRLRRDARVGPFSSSEDPNVDICPHCGPGLGLNAGQRQLGGTTTSPRLGTRSARARLPRPPAMFGPKSGPPKPVPPRRRGAPRGAPNPRSRTSNTPRSSASSRISVRGETHRPDAPSPIAFETDARPRARVSRAHRTPPRDTTRVARDACPRPPRATRPTHFEKCRRDARHLTARRHPRPVAARIPSPPTHPTPLSPLP